MIWTITIATFLATLILFAFVFLLYSHRGRIRDAFRKMEQQKQEKRISTRTAATVSLEISSLGESPIHEITVTENAGHHGVRVVTKNHWQPYGNVQVRFLPEGVLSYARIAYCNPSGNEFAIGLQFSLAIGPWILPNKHKS